VRVEAFGTVDELNSVIGVMLAESLPEDVQKLLTDIQHDLFDLGGELCMPGHGMISEARIETIERILDDLNTDLPMLKEFILPGGTRTASLAHLARTVCRRAERRTVTLAQNESVPPTSIKYLNRLSDLLFVLARALNKRAGKADVLWQPRKNA
jgi:cob(I)alamin adenosyltransferase